MKPYISPEKAAAFVEIMESEEFQACMKRMHETRERIIARVINRHMAEKEKGTTPPPEQES